MILFKDKKSRLKYLVKMKSKIYNINEIESLFNDEEIMRMAHKTIISKALESLIDLDLKISIAFDYMPESTWESINAAYATPCSDNKYENHKKDIQSYLAAYHSLIGYIMNHLDMLQQKDAASKINGKTTIKNSHLEVKMFIEMFLREYDKHITLLKIKNTQFLIFELTTKYPKIVFQYFICKIMERNDLQKYYVSYMFSLFVRCKIKAKIINTVIKSISSDFDLFKDQFVLLQCLLYTCCFYRFIYEYEPVKEFIQQRLSKYALSRINGLVVDTFFGKFDIENSTKIIDSLEKKQIEDVLDFYPFDAAIITELRDKYADNFIEFNKTI